MQKYIKNFLKHYGYGEQDRIHCFMCNREANDIHHVIYRSQGGSDKWDNLRPLCRDHHAEAHTNREFNDRLKEKHFRELNS